MRYFVVWPDGQRFGPADLPLLQQWASENRIGPATVLIEESTNRQVQAAQLGMLTFLPQSGSATPAPMLDAPMPTSPYGGHYPRPMDPASRGSSTEVILAWVFGGLGLFCCTLFALAGVVMAVLGMNKKQPGAKAALVFCIVMLVLSAVVGAVFTILPWQMNL